MDDIKANKHEKKISDSQSENNVFSVSVTEECSELIKNMIHEMENRILELENEKSEIEKKIFEFNRRHTSELGHLILIYLQKRLKHLENIANAFDEYVNTKQQFEDYKNSSESALKRECFFLSEEEKVELKSCFRKASKLTHPDVVPDEHKKEAEKIFIELKDAYDRNDLNQVKNILSDLEKGLFLSGDKDINEREYLLSLFENLRFKVRKMENEINDLKNDKTYLLILSIKDWDDYFSSIKKKLEEELSALE